MVEKTNSFLGNMINKKAAGAEKTPAKPVSKTDTAVATPKYDVETFNMIKFRLMQQKYQLNKMIDYSEDTAIKLGDIYEILQSMNMPSQVAAEKEEIAKSSLDEFFKENGYIPVKVLNFPEGGGGGAGGEFDIDFKRRRGGIGGKGILGKALTAAAILLGASELMGMADYAPEGSDAIPQEPEVNDIPPVMGPEPVGETSGVPSPAIDTPPMATPIPELPATPAPDLIPAPGMNLPDIPKTSAPVPTTPTTPNIPVDQNALNAIMMAITAILGKAAGAPPIGMGGADTMERFSRPSFGGGGVFSVLDPELQLMSQRTNQPKAKQIKITADLMTFEAKNFEFIRRSMQSELSNTAVGNTSPYTLASFAPSSGASGGGMGDGVGTAPPASSGGAPASPSGASGAISSATGGAGEAMSSVGNAMSSLPGMGGFGAAISAAGSGLTALSGAIPGMMGESGSAAAPTGGTISQQQAFELAKNAGFSDEEAKTMAAIAVAESGLNASAFNGNASTGDKSYGLWQINMLGRLGPERRAQLGIQSDEQLFDPATNARAAFQIYKQQGFEAWSVYKSGKYRQYMNGSQAGTGVASEGVSGVAPASSSPMGGLVDYLSGLSKKVTMNLDTQPVQTTTPPTQVPATVTNNISPAYQSVDAPMAAFDKMVERIFEESELV